MTSVLIVGFGYVGRAYAQRVIANGDHVFAIGRSGDCDVEKVEYIQSDVAHVTKEHIHMELDQVVFLVSPDRRDESAYHHVYQEGLANLIQVLQETSPNLRSFILASSTGIYDQKDASWVDETTPLLLTSYRSQMLAHAETLVANSGFPYSIIRFSGIYGPKRHHLLDSVRGGDIHFGNSSIYTNRIHRDDCAAVIDHIAHLENPDPLYVATDCEPVPMNVVISWLVTTLGKTIASMPKESLAEGDTFYFKSNKRCSNAHLLSTGYVFQYPGFQEGFESIIHER